MYRKQIIHILLPALLFVTLGAQPARAQNGIVVENPRVLVDFGRTITFEAKILSTLPIQQASLLFRGVNEDFTRVETVQVAEDGSVSYTYDASLNVLPPFGWVVFWFQATLQDNVTYTSPATSFQYEDNRFDWHKINRANVTVHWYAGDDAFGAAALDAAGRGLLAVNQIIPVSFEEPVDIYIYSNVLDLQNTLALGGEEWVGGHTDPALGIVLAAIAPGVSQFAEMESEIPHEIAHVMLYRALQDGYLKQPAWLLEGFASMMEQYPNPDYAAALKTASERNTLIPMADLCASFPADAGAVFLAYAQSQSFLAYLRSTHGNSGIARLTKAYSDGYSCELGATNALGQPLSRLDARWRETVLGQNVAAVAFRNLYPFMLLLFIVLIVPLWGALDLAMARRRVKHAASQ